jgi:hypothetical protein
MGIDHRGRNTDRAVGRRILQRVIQQIGNHPLDGRGINFDLGQVKRHICFDTSPWEQRPHAIETASNQRNWSDRFVLRLARLPMADARVIYQVVDELTQPVRLAFDLRQEVLARQIIQLNTWSPQGAHEPLDVT